jgi:predicted RNA methylase
VNTFPFSQRAVDVARAVPGLRPLVRTLRVGWVQGWSEALDRWYGIQTTVLSGSHRPQFTDDTGYEPAKYPAIRACLRAVRLSNRDVFFDIGCGMGRVVCMAARHPVLKCIGVEYLPSLAAIADLNAARLRGRRAPVQVWVGDIGDFGYAEGTVFFLYNPFGEQTMRRFIECLRQSLVTRPRRIRIIYVSPYQGHVLSECRWLERQFTLDVHYHVWVKVKAEFWENVDYLASAPNQSVGAA